MNELDGFATGFVGHLQADVVLAVGPSQATRSLEHVLVRARRWFVALGAIDMARSFRQILGPIIALVILVPIAIVLSPLIAVAWSAYVARRIWLIGRLRAAWPPNKFVLVAYTQSELWAPFIEQSLLPQLGDAAVPVDRSKESWKRQNPIEAKAVSFWGGRRAYNPLAIVIRDHWRVRVFRFYEAFQQLEHGRPRELEQLVAEFLAYVKEVARASD